MLYRPVFALVSFIAGSRFAMAVEPPDASPFPAAMTKKGLQVQMVDDAIHLGIGHAALNVDLTQLIDPSRDGDGPEWISGGTRFRFSKAVLDQLDQQVKPLSDHGVAVYLILLTCSSRVPARDELMLHPGYALGQKDAGPIGMFNVARPEGVAWLSATVEFLADRYSRETGHGRVWGYIAGNEVNSHWFWANLGRASLMQVVTAYESAVRLVHSAVRKSSSTARVYISLEHCWGTRYAGGDENQCQPGRQFLTAFAALVREHGDFDWHLAFHPYPEPLTDCRFWRDRKNSPQSDDAPVVSFRNLEVLVHALEKPELRWQGTPRRIILSEQGFHCHERPTGENDQAAAYALAYTKVARIDGIDAFILHRHVDHSGEGGLKLGLWTNRPGTVCTPDHTRLIYAVFIAAGTPREKDAFNFALPVINSASWDEAFLKMAAP